MAIFKEHAGKTGYQVASLQKEVAAADFIADVTGSHSAFARDLSDLGVAAVNQLARLYKEDAALAMDVAVKVVAGEMHWRQIGQARKPSIAIETARRRETCLHRLVEYVREHREKFGVDASKVRIAPGMTSVIAPMDRAISAYLAVQLVEKDAAPERLMRHLAMLTFHDLVFLAIDAAELPGPWLKLIVSMQYSYERFLVLGITDESIRTLFDQSESFLRKLKLLANQPH
ncbi:MAG: hypothetical protein ACTHOP_17750 [Mesorhizobium sp.]